MTIKWTLSNHKENNDVFNQPLHLALDPRKEMRNGILSFTFCYHDKYIFMKKKMRFLQQI